MFITVSKELTHSGPRLDKGGKFIPHSILGTIADFNSTSLKKQQQVMFIITAFIKNLILY